MLNLLQISIVRLSDTFKIISLLLDIHNSYIFYYIWHFDERCCP